MTARTCLLVLLLALVAHVAWAAAPLAGPVETVLPAPAGKTNHGAALTELPGGALLLCWYSGSTEANPDSRILCSDSGDGGLSWTAPRIAVDRGEQAIGAREANKSLGNVTLTFDGTGRLWLIYGVIQRWDWPLVGNVCRNWRCGRVDGKLSSDFGQSWSASVRLDDRIGALPRNRPLHLAGLGDLLPLYLEGEETSSLRLIDLAAWSGRENKGDGRLFPVPGEGLIQPALVPLADGRIRAFFRDSRAIAVRTALFDPRTGFWTEPVATDLPNPGSAVDAFPDGTGRVVVVFNPSRSDRRRLSLARSGDGTHFPEVCDLVPEDAEGDVAYPSVIRTADGRWHVAYSSDGKSRIRHIAFDAGWLENCLRHSSARSTR